MTIDAHTHIGLHNNKEWTPKDLIISMDEADIDYSLVLSNQHKGAEEGLSMDRAVEIAAKFPRIKAIGNVDFGNFDDAQIQKIISYLKTGKIIGVKLYCGYEDYDQNDPKILPIYKFCQGNNKPVVFHTGVLETGFPGLLNQVHPLNIDQVANRFPKLKIVMAHFGNPWVRDTAAVVAKNPNVYVDLSGYFMEYQSIDPKDIEYFIKDLEYLKFFVGDFKKCLFGTDWPLYSQGEYLEAVKKLDITNEEKDLVLWKNTNTVFNLNLNG